MKCAAVCIQPGPDSIGSSIDRAVVDLAEAVILQGHEGESFDAVVTDDDPDTTRIALCEVAVLSKVHARGAKPGDELRVKLVEVDVEQRTVEFQRVS